ncbi:hypothetical protein PRUPE_6G313100 [Prunus persica]|uniref:Uncharacterized protein n=1 Tax=Prunus persica TaxID=3760 RepID=M5WQ55_PRUPE|nr:hypothetical protein PRUPE_6G313100 [Prunus persica]
MLDVCSQERRSNVVNNIRDMRGEETNRGISCLLSVFNTTQKLVQHLGRYKCGELPPNHRECFMRLILGNLRMNMFGDTEKMMFSFMLNRPNQIVPNRI